MRKRFNIPKRLKIISILVICAAVILTGIAIHRQHTRHIAVPDTTAAVLRQAAFITFVPVNSSDIYLHPASLKYDSSSQLLSYTAAYAGNQLIVSEQAAPATFTDVAGYYDKWLDSFGEYTSFGSAIGTMHLANSPKLSPYSFAIADTQGTLLFIKPNHQLSQDDWRRVCNSLHAVQPS